MALQPVFQSPIGTNKTLLEEHLTTLALAEVSIPYRYKQNYCLVLSSMFFSVVSIPYRYKQNSYCNEDYEFEADSFNPL